MLNFLKYPGNKTKYLNQIKQIIDTSNAITYIEPFLGSATIMINLTKHFQNIIGSDVDQRIINIFKTFSKVNYQQIKYVYNELIIKQFGNIGKNKESYYTFRKYMNQMQQGDQKNIALYYAIRSCINSMVRFGPNGFNQSFGNRGKDIYLNKDDLIKLNNVFSRSKLFIQDYKILMFDKKLQNDKNILWILDPPYYNSKDVYSKNFNDFNYDEFKLAIKSIKGDIIYFDVENQFGNQFFENKIIIRDNMKNISPNRKDSQYNTFTKQIMYYNNFN